MNIGDRIKLIRKDTGLTQKDFAEKLGLFRGSLANYETGRANPISSVIVLISREFNVNEEWLRTGNGEMYLRPEDNDAALVEWVADVCNNRSMRSQRRLLSIMRSLSAHEADVIAEAIDILIAKAEEIAEDK